MMVRCVCENWNCPKTVETTCKGKNEIFHYQCWSCDRKIKVLKEID